MHLSDVKALYEGVITESGRKVKNPRLSERHKANQRYNRLFLEPHRRYIGASLCGRMQWVFSYRVTVDSRKRRGVKSGHKMASFVPALHQDVAMAEETPRGNRVRKRHRKATESERDTERQQSEGDTEGNRVRKRHRAVTE